jgi:hypothetical protein
MWGKYERDLAVPGGEVLAKAASAGLDVLYILTGEASLPGAEREDEHMISEAGIREPGGRGPMHDLLLTTMARKAKHTAQRRQRLKVLSSRLALCAEPDFLLIEQLAARIFGDSLATTDGGEGNKAS